MTFDRPALNQALHTALRTQDLDALRAALTPSATRSEPRIREDLEGQDAGGNTLWLIAAHLGHLPNLELLAPWVRHRDHRNTRGRSALHRAVLAGHRPAALALIERWGLSPHAQDQQGRSPLICAAEIGDLAMVQALTPCSDLLAHDKDGINALGYAWKSVHADRWAIADHLACAMPEDRVVPSIEAVMVGALWPSMLARNLPHWSVRREQSALRATLDEALGPSDAPPPVAIDAAPRLAPQDPRPGTVPATVPSRARRRL